MNHLIVRLAASGAIAASLAAPVLAGDSSHIGFTGPESRNIISLNHSNRFNENIRNNVGITNNNVQNARSGNVLVDRNNVVGGVRSGDAINTNRTSNQVSINTPSTFRGDAFSGGPGFGFDGDRGSAFIDNTGPESKNIIRDNRNRNVDRNVNNTVGITNNNNQNAQSGNVRVSNNGFVHGPVSSGDAINFNQTSNRVDIR